MKRGTKTEQVTEVKLKPKSNLSNAMIEAEPEQHQGCNESCLEDNVKHSWNPAVDQKDKRKNRIYNGKTKIYFKHKCFYVHDSWLYQRWHQLQSKINN